MKAFCQKELSPVQTRTKNYDKNKGRNQFLRKKEGADERNILKLAYHPTIC
jgi:hypothetical protein